MKKMASATLAMFMLAFCLSACAQGSSSEASNASTQVESTPSTSTPASSSEAKLAGTHPLTGMPLSEDYDETQRIVAVMVDGIRAALPQRGMSSADITYEMITEGGITRFMCLYLSTATMPEVGPIRSGRDQHVQMMIPLAALYLHIGGSTYSSSMLQDYAWENKDVDARKYTAQALRFDAARETAGAAFEQSWFSSGDLLQSTLENSTLQAQVPKDGQRGPAFEFVPHSQPPRVLADGDAPEMYVRFSGYANSSFTYNTESGQYEKSTFGQPQIDENTNTQLSYQNVLVLFTEVKRHPDGVLAKIDFSINGVGYYFSGGRYERVRWLKGTPAQPLRILNSDGTEKDAQINPGNTYIAFVSLEDFDYFSIIGSPDTQAALPDSAGPAPGEDVGVSDESMSVPNA